MENLILGGGKLNLAELRQLQRKPPPYTPGESLFWTDPHISTQMLATHLDPDTDAASRRPETIERSVAWIAETLGLQPDDAVIDLGCGPGLYSARFAARGLRVTGVDFSRGSLDYAAQRAREQNLDIRYRHQDYLTLDDESEYDAALLIYGDFCPLAPAQRTCLLQNVHRALRSNGRFVLDVSRRRPHQTSERVSTWHAEESGFWRPAPHLVLEQRLDYPDEPLHLDQYIVVEGDGSVTVYRIWCQEYSEETIRAELETDGFTVQGLWGDLAGAPCSEDAEWIGIVAQKD